ncbi:MAG: glutathione-disulfide reductase [Hyphomicrobiaceae bacterium]|nr:glutathione-disulfide reductase [Hyphomicrobiaceae bacterium]
MTKYDFDLFVIGGGSGGVRAARVAAGHGASVAIAEEFRFGGTCVIRGCVPKKLLVYASRFADEFEDAAGFGWSVGETTFDWGRLVANKDREIARLEAIYRGNLEKAGVSIFDERAEVAGPHSVRLVKENRSVSARVILVATGASPYIDTRVLGCEHVITSNDAFHLGKLPRRMVIAGGGYIAVEFAGIFAGLGVETTLVHRGQKVLRGFDEDLRDALMAEYAKRGIKLVMSCTFLAIRREVNGIVGVLSDGTAVEADEIMFAIGRYPNSARLGLKQAGVALGETGAVKVDADGRTNVPGIYAIGDVTDRVNLTPVAIREGHAFADTVFGSKPWRVDYDNIPTAVFSTPEIGTVGLPEQDAIAAGYALDIYKSRFRPMKHTLSGRDERTTMKIVVDQATQKVLGVHMLGPDAGEIAQMAAIALSLGATKGDFDSTMALHPSAAEELVTMREKWAPQGMAAE